MPKVSADSFTTSWKPGNAARYLRSHGPSFHSDDLTYLQQSAKKKSKIHTDLGCRIDWEWNLKITWKKEKFLIFKQACVLFERWFGVNRLIEGLELIPRVAHQSVWGRSDLIWACFLSDPITSGRLWVPLWSRSRHIWHILRWCVAHLSWWCTRLPAYGADVIPDHRRSFETHGEIHV